MRFGGHRKEVRGSALWGSGKRGTGSRGNALWGSGKRRTALLTTLVLTLAVPFAASAGSSGPKLNAFVTPSLLSSASSGPADTFSVIVQGRGGNQAAKALSDLLGSSKKAYKNFESIDGLAVELTGAQIQQLAMDSHVTAITPDARVRLSGENDKWPYVVGAQKYWGSTWSSPASAATIAIVDSGIDATRPDFGSRVIANVNLSGLSGNSAGDGRGHGTMVAGIAAGEASGRKGVAPRAKLVSIDVMDDQGMARTSDVIAAADWILANKAKYGIRIANFSLHSSMPSSFMFDPLAKAAERLWLNNVVVVAAAGNYGSTSGPSGVYFAPANDPFVITVGATDTGRSVSTYDDVAAPWSAYGYTLDGFAKPDIGAPGRYMVGPVPTTATLYSERPDHIASPGYMELSGTSFSAPVVSGVAALILGRHPDWTADQVKGALMLGAKYLSNAKALSVGVGEVNAPKSIELYSAPNPNAGLNAFVGTDSASGQLAFDAASWASKAKSDASWASASWAAASWATASWADNAQAAASWADMSLASASWADNAISEDAALTAGAIDPLELQAILAGTLTP